MTTTAEEAPGLLRLEADVQSDTVDLDAAWFAQRVLEQGGLDAEARARPQVIVSEVVFGRMATLVPVLLGPVEDGDARIKVMVKRVVPDELPHAAEEKDKYEAFIASVQREMHFYRDEVDTDEDLFPKVFAFIERVVNGKPAFLLVMEDVKRLGYEHVKAASQLWHIEQALAAFARLNSGRRLQTCLARYDGLQSLDSAARDLERGGFWVLSRRPAAELNDGPQNWAAFLERFKDRLGEPRVQKLADFGVRLAAIAPELQEVVRSRSVSLIHGDAKSWNLFYPIADRHAPVKLIDMQWKGLGHPLQDFVYFMTTSVDPNLLRDEDLWRRLLAFFRGLLQAHLDVVHARANAAQYRDIVLCESLDAFQELAELVWLDYVRVVVFGLWRRLDPAKQDANASKIGISLVTSSVDQMLWVLDRALHLLDHPPALLANCLDRSHSV